MDLFIIALAILAGFTVGDWVCKMIDLVVEGNSYNKPWERWPHG